MTDEVDLVTDEVDLVTGTKASVTGSELGKCWSAGSDGCFCRHPSVLVDLDNYYVVKKKKVHVRHFQHFAWSGAVTDE